MKREDKLNRDVAKVVVRTFFNYGLLGEDDLNLSDEEFGKKCLQIFKPGSWDFVVDHRDDIVQQADIFFNTKQYDYATLFYAMFFEHSLNSMVSEQCIKKNIDNKTTIEIVRCTDIHAKLTWLLKLLDLPRVNEKHIKVIKKVSEERNAFVHYKWKGELDGPVGTSKKREEEINGYFKQVKRTVKYIRQLTGRVMFKGLKKKIDKRISDK